MAELWLEYLMNFLGLLSILAAAYYWYLMSRAELPAAGAGEAGETAQALVGMAALGKRAAGYSALGGVLLVAASLMGIFADLP